MASRFPPAHPPPPTAASPSPLGEASLGILALGRGAAHHIQQGKQVAATLTDDDISTTMVVRVGAVNGSLDEAVLRNNTGAVEGGSTPVDCTMTSNGDPALEA